jgi:protein involved in polysaccharide export with SLBB domain
MEAAVQRQLTPILFRLAVLGPRMYPIEACLADILDAMSAAGLLRPLRARGEQVQRTGQGTLPEDAGHRSRRDERTRAGRP